MNAKKIVTAGLALVMVAGISVAGTLAYLTAETEKVENTFTVGNVDLTLAETTKTYKMVPGQDIAKDPKITLSADSEDAYLYVEVVESKNLDSYISYTMNTDWTKLDGVYAPNNGTIYYYNGTITKGQAISVLMNDKVTTLDTVTKSMMDNIEDGTADESTLTFYGYAIQKAGFDTAADAWGENYVGPSTAG